MKKTPCEWYLVTTDAAGRQSAEKLRPQPCTDLEGAHDQARIAARAFAYDAGLLLRSFAVREDKVLLVYVERSEGKTPRTDAPPAGAAPARPARRATPRRGSR